MTSIGLNLADTPTVNFFAQHLSGVLAFAKLLSKNVDKDIDADDDPYRPVHF